jgi:hypothetical protein
MGQRDGSCLRLGLCSGSRHSKLTRQEIRNSGYFLILTFVDITKFTNAPNKIYRNWLVSYRQNVLVYASIVCLMPTRIVETRIPRAYPHLFA